MIKIFSITPGSLVAAEYLKNKVMTIGEAIEILNITCGKQIYCTADEQDIKKLKQAFNIAIAAIRDSQPDWSKAPDWAEWYAVDADGQTNWFEQKPEKIRSNWHASDGINQTVVNSMKLFKRPE